MQIYIEIHPKLWEWLNVVLWRIDSFGHLARMSKIVRVMTNIWHSSVTLTLGLPEWNPFTIVEVMVWTNLDSSELLLWQLCFAHSKQA